MATGTRTYSTMQEPLARESAVLTFHKVFVMGLIVPFFRQKMLVVKGCIYIYIIYIYYIYIYYIYIFMGIQGGAPPVISWFTNPINHSCTVGIINHSFWSYKPT